MSIDDVIERANGGDIQAMLELSRYYNQQRSYEGAESSVFWSEKAAELGDPNGIMQTAYGYPVLASINETSSVGDYHSSLYQWKRAKRWAIEALNQVSLDSDEKRELSQLVDDATYGMAVSHYYLKEYVEVLNCLAGCSDPRSMILRGCSSFESAVSDSSETKMQVAFDNLRSVEMNREYLASISTRLESEQRLFVKGSRYLAGIYRIGIRGRVSADLDSAVSILNNAINTINDKDLKTHIQSDLDHYRKKLFGGYKYV